MKLNKYLKQIILIINISVIISSCSLFQHATYNQSDYLDHFKKYTKPFANNVYNKKIQLQIQELQNSNIVYFPLDQYQILDQFFHILNIHADFLNNNTSFHVNIEGHADERGTPEYNIALGERRANSVKLYLQSKGVLSEQIFTISYGKEKPAELGHNEEAYAKNRRVVLITYP